jgi:threonine/homoserine/homoserine lactone efflux protein
MLSIHNALHDGWRYVLRSSPGKVSGLLVRATSSALGLNALRQSSEPAFTVVQTAGTADLIWLGLQQWRKRDRPAVALAQERGTRAYSGRLTPAD